MAYTTITAAQVGIADGDTSPQPIDGTIRITPRFPAAGTPSGFIATGPIIVTVTGGAIPRTEVPAQEDATALIEFHLYDRNAGPIRLPNTEIPLEPNATINLRDYLPAGVDPATGQGLAKGDDGAGITGITATNGMIIIKWEGGSDVTIPVPDAVQGVGVDDAINPVFGSVAFTLTDGSTTSSVDLPPGPKGQDGSNVLPARTAIVSEAWQPDFVELARSRSPYDRMTLTATSGGGFLVRCLSGAQTGADSLTYQITAGPRYRLVAAVTEYSLERGGGYVPDPTDVESSFPSDVRIENGDVTTSGTWNTNSTWYTTEEGATWEASITTTSPGDEIFMSFYHDNRGGVWRIQLAENPTITADVSVYRSASGTDANNLIFAVPTPGTYTLRGTFLGADPSNPPSGGTARGWLMRADTSPAYYMARVSTFELEGATLTDGGASNKNWALRATHPEVGVEEFMPWHGQNVETIVSPPEFYDRGRQINTGSLSTGDTIEVGDFSMIQHIKCHNSASPDELIDVHTIDAILPDGTYQANGRIEVLHDLVSTDQMYTGMLPFNPSELNRVVTSLRTSYPAGPEMSSQSSTRLGDDGLHSTSVAVVGDDPNVVAAVRFNAPEETRRMSVSDNFGDTTNVPMFIDHRSESLGKVYPRFGYVDGTLVHVGTVWRFSADYWFGRIPGVRQLIE